MDAKELTEKICKAASAKKANNLVILEMKGLTIATDYFVIGSAATATQVRAISDNIEEELEKLGINFLHKEGYNEGEWILLDYGDVVAHIFRDVNRDYYKLEELWQEAKQIKYED